MSLDTVNVSIAIKLRPFNVPEGVIIEQRPGKRQDGITAIPLMPLDELELPALHALAQRFITDLYKKAGHSKATPILCPEGSERSE